MTNHCLQYNVHLSQSEELGLWSQREWRWKPGSTITLHTALGSYLTSSSLLFFFFFFLNRGNNSSTFQLSGTGVVRESRRQHKQSIQHDVWHRGSILQTFPVRTTRMIVTFVYIYSIPLWARSSDATCLRNKWTKKRQENKAKWKDSFGPNITALVQFDGFLCTVNKNRKTYFLFYFFLFFGHSTWLAGS